MIDEYGRPEDSEEDTRLLILLIIHQAIYDVRAHNKLLKATTGKPWEAIRLAAYKTSREFIFDDDYLLDWGDLEVSPRDLCAYVGIDLDALREWILADKIEFSPMRFYPEDRASTSCV